MLPRPLRKINDFGEVAMSQTPGRQRSAGARGRARIEGALLTDVVGRMAGYRGLIVGPMSALPDRRLPWATLSRWHIDRRPGPGVDAVFDGASLPVMSGSIDVLILSHGLEISPEPHRLMRECARVLSRRGQWLSLVDNPISPAVIGRELWQVGTLPSACRAVPRAARVIDWLRLMGFETTDAWRYGTWLGRVAPQGLAMSTPGLAPLGWLFGGYAVLARRHVRPDATTGRRRMVDVPRGAALARRAHDTSRQS